MLFWTDVAVLLLVRAIRTLLVPITYEALVDAATVVLAAKKYILIVITFLWSTFYIREVGAACTLLAPIYINEKVEN